MFSCSHQIEVTSVISFCVLWWLHFVGSSRHEASVPQRGRKIIYFVVEAPQIKERLHSHQSMETPQPRLSCCCRTEKPLHAISFGSLTSTTMTIPHLSSSTGQAKLSAYGRQSASLLSWQKPNSLNSGNWKLIFLLLKIKLSSCGWSCCTENWVPNKAQKL